MDWKYFVVAAVLAVVAGFLASIDAALSAFSKARAEELAGEGRSGAHRLAMILEDPAPAINTMLLLRTIAETAAIVLAALIVASHVDALWRQITIAVVIMVIVSYVLLGVGPRTLGRQHSERVALLSAAPVAFITRLLGPLPRILIATGNALTPGEGFREGPFASEVEVRELVDLAAASSIIETVESQMIHSVFELGDTIAREVMVPRTDIVFVESSKTLRQTLSLGLRSGYSRIPVIGENLDDIVGMAYLKDVTKRIFDNREAESTERIETMARQCLFVPDTQHADALLREMQAKRMHVAIVVDEFGGTAGMVTIEDILEEIVGEITDEFDAEEIGVERLSDGSFRISSRYEVDDLVDLFDIAVEDEDVDSVGGLIAKHLGKVPITGSVVEVEGLRFEAESQSGRRNRIDTVLVSKVAESSGAEHNSLTSDHGPSA